jgi:fatty acid desaturase
MGYAPLDEVRKSLKVKWYRVPVAREKLLELSKPSDAQGWFQAGGHFGLLLLTGVVTWVFWSEQMWVLFALSLFAHGTVASSINGIAPHELGHGTVFRTKWLNKFYLHLFSLISWWDPYDYASSHTYHHRYTLHPEGDRENLLPLEPTLVSPFMWQLFTINLFTKRGRVFSKGGLLSTITITFLSAFGIVGSSKVPQNEWIKALHTDQPDQARSSMWWSRALLLFHGLVVVVAILTGWWVLPLLVTSAAFTANWLAYFFGMTQHCGLKENTNDFRKSVRSIRLDPFSEFLYWRMNWHTEHHMYAGVPCYNLKALYREIADEMPEPRSLWGAWREMRDTWKRQQSDPDYAFDTPLPESAGFVGEDSSDELDSSIGDLAPRGLQ